MQIVETDVAIGELHFDILNIKRVVGEVDVGGQATQRESAALIKRQTLDADAKVVVF